MPQTMTDTLVDRTMERATQRRDRAMTVYENMNARFQALEAQFSSCLDGDDVEECPTRTKIKCKLESASDLLPKAEKLSVNPTSTKAFRRMQARVEEHLDDVQSALGDLLPPPAEPKGMTPG